MESRKQFKIKSGYCQVYPDKIVVTGDDVADDKPGMKTKEFFRRFGTVNGLIAIVSLIITVNYLLVKSYVTALYPAAIACYMIYRIIADSKSSNIPAIERSAIQKVKFIQGIPRLSNARFEIFYADNKGRIKTRTIKLTGNLSGKNNETDMAYKLMVEEDLIGR
ncbi:MAG TPA: hypothetical protein VE870_00090 [Bacteroidales bacterium]|nr:hypothetical protein [Bacteroidales bacterium]